MPYRSPLPAWRLAKPQASTVACFTPADAKAAQFRRMQQEFTVAALSCGWFRPQRELLTDRYNRFVAKFAAVLRDNARILTPISASMAGRAASTVG